MNNITPLPIDHHNSNGVRDSNGRFLRGPGRKYGSKNKQAAELMKVVRAMGPRAIDRLSAALDDGKQWSIELILKYCLPPSRTVEMEGAEPEDIKQAFITGDLSADEAKSIATAMEKLKNVQDLDDLRERLSELEQLLQQQSKQPCP
jgi:hypothetical protein